jgi:hypothetical protein
MKETLAEPVLPEPETLLVQFSGRLIFSSSDVCDERLTIRYWLSIPNDEAENENVSCDLAEIARQYLPQDFNIAREIEKTVQDMSVGKQQREGEPRQRPEDQNEEAFQ